MTRIAIVIAAALAFTATLPAVSAHAAARDRVFVASYGNDSNPCTFGSPCKTFQHAVDVVAVGGEVTAIDSAGFGPFTVSHAITITSPNGVEAGIAAPASGTAAITINAGPSDIIVLNGLTLDGDNVPNTAGIVFSSGGTLTVRDCVIRDFSDDGIYFVPIASGLSQLFMSNTLVSDNGGDGIYIGPSGSGTTTGVLDHVKLENNFGNGLAVATTSTQTINVTVSDSVSANNEVGIYTESSTSTAVSVMVRNCTIANNAAQGLWAHGTGATIRVTRSTITGNGTAWLADASGVVLSYTDNNIDGNGSANSAPPNPLVYQ